MKKKVPVLNKKPALAKKLAKQKAAKRKVLTLAEVIAVCDQLYAAKGHFHIAGGLVVGEP